jgi:type I restriction enzyme S subunit
MNINLILENLTLFSSSPDRVESLRKLIYKLATSGALSDRKSNEKKADFKATVGESEIPNNWIWCELQEIAIFGGRGSIKPELIPEDSWLLDLEDIEKVSSKLLVRTRARDRRTTSNKAIFKEGDVLYGKLRPYLDKVLVADMSGYCTTEIVAIQPHDGLDPRWLRICLKRPEFISKVTELSYGTKMPRLGTDDAKKSLHPIPPLEEQRRIVAEVEKLLELCDQIEDANKYAQLININIRKSAVDAISIAQTPEELQVAWQRIQDNWEVIAVTPEATDSMKTLILDLAVRGDLVTVDSPKVVESIEWTSSQLKLDDSKIWSLPTLHKERKMGWNRIPLAKLGFWGSGGTPTSSRKDYYQNGTIPWAVIGDMNDEVMTTTEARITEKALSESSSKLIPVGAILIAMYATSIGKTALTGIECCSNQAIAHCVVDAEIVSKEYFFIIAKSLKRHLIRKGRGAAQSNISQSVLKHLIIDLPPLAEQALIVERVEALMELCDRLNLSLQESEVLAEKFSRSVVSASA